MKEAKRYFRGAKGDNENLHDAKFELCWSITVPTFAPACRDSLLCHRVTVHVVGLRSEQSDGIERLDCFLNAFFKSYGIN